MRINMISPYDHFPNHNPVDGEPYINCYNDFHVWDEIKPNSIALLIEPRCLQPEVYKWVEQNYKKFAYVFTHDSILLECIPNAKIIYYGNIIDSGYNPETNSMYWKRRKNWDCRPKSKKISFCSSGKEMCIQHIRRKELCKELQGVIDCMGSYNGGAIVNTEDYLADYMFTVCIENYRDDYWFTERICNAFAYKCVPIYYGARKIGEIFDEHGIVTLNSLNELPTTIAYLLDDISYQYEKRRVSIENNYILAKKFENFEFWFFREYDELLEELYAINNNNTCV